MFHGLMFTYSLIKIINWPKVFHGLMFTYSLNKIINWPKVFHGLMFTYSLIKIINWPKVFHGLIFFENHWHKCFFTAILITYIKGEPLPKCFLKLSSFIDWCYYTQVSYTGSWEPLVFKPIVSSFKHMYKT